MVISNGSVPTPPKGNEYYEVRKIPGKGYGCFALMPIPRGTRILEDDPLLAVPFRTYLKSDIEDAAARLTPEQKKLYFSLHSGHGQDPRQWPSKIHGSVEPRERQRIEEQHAARIGNEATWMSIFQTNCMEMGKGAAVFPYAARFNHSCNPNACFSWNPSINKETIHVINDVAAGEEITLSYCDMIHDKPSRAYELKHYGFVCDCPACAGDESDETSFAHQTAIRRFLLQELDHETRMWRGAMLLEGIQQPQFVNKLLQLAALHDLEGDYTARLAAVYLDIALVCEHHNDLGMARAAAVKAAQVKRGCQGVDFPNYKKYVEVLDRIKTKLALQENEHDV